MVDNNKSFSTGNKVTPTAQKNINHLITYIQTHLDEPLDLVQLGYISGYSHFHINRIFLAHTGETLGIFIRRLRLGRAIQWLLGTRNSITDIALMSGYDTPAAFTKAFRQCYGVPPSQVRKYGEIPKIQIKNEDLRIRLRSILMEPEIRFLSEKRILNVERKGLINNNFNKTADRAFSILTAFIRLENLWGMVETCLGITPDDGSEVPANESRYIAGYFLKEGAEVEPRGEVKILIYPAGNYAVFLHKGPYENLWQTWNSIYRDWLPISGLTLRDQAPFEVYLNEKRRTQTHELKTEIYIPIE